MRQSAASSGVHRIMLQQHDGALDLGCNPPSVQVALLVPPHEVVDQTGVVADRWGRGHNRSLDPLCVHRALGSHPVEFGTMGLMPWSRLIPGLVLDASSAESSSPWWRATHQDTGAPVLSRYLRSEERR